jgi:Uma2 family endonuclease
MRLCCCNERFRPNDVGVLSCCRSSLRQQRMGRGEFRQWAEQQEGTLYERVNGEPVAIASECAIHARIKTRVWQALDRELRDHGSDCEAWHDGRGRHRLRA